jgi:unsaturated rhamnogalacturonyl hydrolase
LTERIRRAAQHLLAYGFRNWGFGEGIAIRALLETHDLTHEGFVRGLFASWLGRGGAKSFEDHVAPGLELLMLYERTRDPALLDAARRLARLHATFPVCNGVCLHRPDLPGMKGQIWVDCMHIDGPFFARLGRVTGEEQHFDQAANQVLSYARVLQAPNGLFRHGWETACGPNGQLWARGNGWALTGMVDTLSELPPAHPACTEIRQRLGALVGALREYQTAEGLWHTVLNDESTYLETTLAAMVAYALREDPGTHEPMRAAAEAAVLRHVDESGRLQFISEATPVAEHRMYATRSFGVYPWGQGPLILLYCKMRNENEDRQS